MRKSVPWLRGAAVSLAGISMALAMPARADGVASSASLASDGAGAGEKLRRLDIMLMVTGLRCRNTADDFQADFQALEARHLGELNAAVHQMMAAYAGRMSADDAAREVDRLTVQMANRYGNGHPWLGCRELKGLAHALAAQDGPEVLLAAASETLDGDESPVMASAPPASPPLRAKGGVIFAAR